MICFVTGATGFVGGHLCERLVSEGHEVIALARENSNRESLEQLGVRIVNGTVDSINVFAHYAQEVDVFFHLAAVTKPLKESDFKRINSKGTDRIISGLERGAFRGKFLLLSSQAAGGPAKNAEEPRTEEDKDRPVSTYGKSKLLAEKYVRTKLPEGCPWTILRPGAIYGPREHEILEVLKMVNQWGVAVQFGPGVTVQMTHVHDVVEAIMTAAFSPEANGQIYYLTDNTPWNFEDVINLAGEALGKKVRTLTLPMAVGQVLAAALDTASRLAGKSLSPLGRDKFREMSGRYWVASSKKLEQDLNWHPRYQFTEGMMKTIEWYLENGWIK